MKTPRTATDTKYHYAVPGSYHTCHGDNLLIPGLRFGDSLGLGNDNDNELVPN